MSGRPLSGATCNGFDKGDVYNALTKAIIMKKYEELCYYCAELACTPKELPHLMGHLLDIFSKYTNFDNIQLLRRVNMLMQEMCALPKKQVLTNNYFQRILCELSIMISVYKRTQPLDLVVKEQGCNYTIVEHYICKYNNKDFDFIRETFKPHNTSNEMLKLFDIIYNLVKHSDKKGIAILISHIVNSKSFNGLQNINYDEIVNVPENTRNDVTWYIWRLLLCIVHHRYRDDAHVKESIAIIFELFLAMYQKKNRMNRMNLLIYSFNLLCDDKFKVIDKPIESKLISEAVNKIHIVYNDVLAKESVKSAFTGDLAYLDPGKCTAKVEDVPRPPVVKPVEEEKPKPQPVAPTSEDKMSYLNKMIYFEE